MKLSLQSAAEECPRKLAVIDGERHVDFSELSARMEHCFERNARPPANGREDPTPIEGHSTLETLEALYARIETRGTVLMLHPRASASEHAALLALVRAHWSASRFAAASFPETCLALLTTSGSLRQAKLVALSYRAFMESAEAVTRALSVRASDRWLLSLSPAHIGGLSIVTRCLWARAAVVLPTGSGADDLLASLHEARVTLASLVPTQLERLLQTAARPPESLRVVLLGGAPARPTVLARARELGWPVRATYGLTEACSMVTLGPSDAESREEGDAGRPLPGIELRIVDGTIRVRGPTLMSGYLPPYPESLGEDGWFSTRDLGSFDEDGRLRVHGRADDAILTGGEKVQPIEVEAVLLEAPGVVQACVFGVEDPEWGERVAAALVTTTELDWEELDGLLERRLARFKHPRLVAIADSLAQTASGKIDRGRITRDQAPRLEPWPRAPAGRSRR
jgi:O-succinylbenzoic acid--CoA ligase